MRTFKQQFIIPFPILFLILPQFSRLDKQVALCYPCTGTELYLQGGVRFPTGGKVRERYAQNRCDSGTDSRVWMEEDMRLH